MAPGGARERIQVGSAVGLPSRQKLLLLAIQAINSNTRNLPKAPEGGLRPPSGAGGRGGIPAHPFRHAGTPFGRAVFISPWHLALPWPPWREPPAGMNEHE